MIVAACAIGVPRSAHADPQGNVGLTIGGGAVGAEGRFWDHAEFHMGLHGDVMFARDDPWDFGVGPYLEIGTFAFDEFQFGGGPTFHIPVHETWPLVASLGAFGRIGDDDFGLEPGLAAGLFWGSRSYNFHGDYIMAAGLSVGFRQVLGESRESTLLVAAHIDLLALGIPFVLLINALRGPTAEAEPLR